MKYPPRTQRGSRIRSSENHLQFRTSIFETFDKNRHVRPEQVAPALDDYGIRTDRKAGSERLVEQAMHAVATGGIGGRQAEIDAVKCVRGAIVPIGCKLIDR